MKYLLYVLCGLGAVANAQSSPSSDTTVTAHVSKAHPKDTVAYKQGQLITIQVEGLPSQVKSLTFVDRTGSSDGQPIPVVMSEGTARLGENGPNALFFSILNEKAGQANVNTPNSLSAKFITQIEPLGTLTLLFTFQAAPEAKVPTNNPPGQSDDRSPTGFIIPDALKLKFLLEKGNPADAEKFSKQVQVLYDINDKTPFYTEFLVNTQKVALMSGEKETVMKEEKKQTILSNALSTVGGLDVTTFADGLAQFLVKRTKEELNTAFFERFRDLLQQPRYKDVKLIFPQTNQTLLALGDEIFNYEAYLTSLRTSFEKDLRTLPPHLTRWVDEGTFKDYFASKPYLTSSLKTSLYFYDELANGTHPGQAIENFPLAYTSSVLIPTSSTESIRVDSLTKVFKVLSKSLQSGNASHYWVTPDTINAVVNDAKTRKLYLAMLFKYIKGIEYKTNKVEINAKDVKEWEGKLDKVSRFITRTHSLEDALKRAKVVKNKDSLGYEFYTRFFDEFTQTIEAGHDMVLKLIFSKDQPDPTSKFTKAVELLRNVSELGLDVSRRKYGAAVVHAAQVYTYLTGDATLFDNKVPIGFTQTTHQKDVAFVWSKEPDALVANLSNNGIKAVWDAPSNQLGIQFPNEDANSIHKIPFPVSSDALVSALNSLSIGQQAIQASLDQDSIRFSLPSGFRKRMVSLTRTVSVETKAQDIINQLLMYGSFIAAVAEAKTSDEVADAIESFALPAGSSRIKRESRFNVSLNAYVGLLVGWEKIGGVWKSGGLFQPNSFAVAAPLGVAASWGRVFNTHGSLSVFASIIDVGAVTAYRFQNDADTLTTPSIKLKDIIAPGLALAYGFGKTPLSLLAGWQSGPLLRRIDAKNANAEIYDRYSRWYLTLTVDIPILNFFNRK